MASQDHQSECQLHYVIYHFHETLILIVEVSLKSQSAVWLVLSGMVIFVLGAVLGWYGFPALIRSQIIAVSIITLSRLMSSLHTLILSKKSQIDL